MCDFAQRVLETELGAFIEIHRRQQKSNHLLRPVRIAIAKASPFGPNETEPASVDPVVSLEAESTDLIRK